MSQYTADLILFDASALYKSDPAKAIDEFKGTIKDSLEHVKIYHGSLVEDKEKAAIVIFHTSPTPTSPPPSTFSSPSFGGPTVTHRLTLEQDPTGPFTSPVTEFAIATLSDPANKDKLIDNVKSLSKFDTKGLLAKTWGGAVDDEKVYVYVGGWESYEAHMEARKTISEEAKAVAVTTRAIAAINLKHATLTLSA